MNKVKALAGRQGPQGRGLILLSLVVILITASVLSLFPRRVTADTAGPERFSGERAMAHLPIIAREPHPYGSPAQARERDYLAEELKKIGLENGSPGGPRYGKHGRPPSWEHKDRFSQVISH